MIELSSGLVLAAFDLLDPDRPASQMEIARAIAYLHERDTVRLSDDIRSLMPQTALHGLLDQMVKAGELRSHSGMRWRMKAVTLGDLKLEGIYYARTADADRWAVFTLEKLGARRRALAVLAQRHASELDELVFDQLLDANVLPQTSEQEGKS